MIRFVLALALAAAGMLATPSIVLAANAIVTRDADVFRRATGNTVVNDVEEDQLVTVTECRERRCFVQIPGRDGWVNRSRLEPFDDEDDDGGGGPSVTFDFGGIGITLGEDGADVSVGGISGPTSGPRACFYEHNGYAGAGFCVRRGETIANVGAGWNDRISSIRLYGGASVEVCEHEGFIGACQSYGSNRSSIGGFNDQITSVAVY